MIAGLLGGLLFAWQWRYGFNVGDEGWLWYISQRIRFGEMPIRDTFGYDPGRYLWSAAWFRILGADGLFEQRLANSIFGIIGIIFAYVAMMQARIKAAIRIPVAIILAIALCYPLHKVYEQSLSLIGVALVAYVLRNPTTPHRWLVLGAGTGIAACLGRNSGVYYLIASCAAAATAWQILGRKLAIRSTLLYLVGVLAGYSPMITWFVFDNRFRHAMIESVLFTSQWLLPLPIPFPWRINQSISSIPALQSTMVSWLVVLTITLYLARIFVLFKKIIKKNEITSILALEAASIYVGIPYLQQALDRADFSHIAQGILPLFLLSSTQLARPIALRNTLLPASFLLVAMISWLPSEPAIQFLLNEQKHATAAKVEIDGHQFELNAGTALLLSNTRRIAEACQVGDGQLVAMPHFPGLLAYLHVRSPYWEMYYLYPRDTGFQQREINQIEKYGTKVAVIDWDAALDGRKDMRFEALNPMLGNYIRTNFKDIKDALKSTGGTSFMVRSCPAYSN